MFKVHFFLDTKGVVTTHAQRIIKLGEAENFAMLFLIRLLFPSANLTYTETPGYANRCLLTGAFTARKTQS